MNLRQTRRHIRKTRLGALGGACGTTSTQLVVVGRGQLLGDVASGASGGLSEAIGSDTT